MKIPTSKDYPTAWRTLVSRVGCNIIVIVILYLTSVKVQLKDKTNYTRSYKRFLRPWLEMIR